MLESERINRLYNIILEDNEITTETLNNNGYTQSDITYLIENGYIKIMSEDHFSILKSDILLSFGLKFKNLKQYEKAEKCFLECIKIEPGNILALYNLLVHYIANRRYDEAIEHLKVLYEFETDKNKLNLYLYLLNTIITFLKNTSNYHTYFKFDDIKSDSSKENIIIEYIYKHKFVNARKKMEEFTNSSIYNVDNYSYLNNTILYSLINKADEASFNFKIRIFNLLQEEKYQEIIDIIENIKNKCNTSLYEKSILSLTKDLLYIIKTGEIPKVEPQKIQYKKLFYKLIFDKKYKEALERIELFDSNYNIIRLLLQKINEEIIKIESKDKNDDTDIIFNICKCLTSNCIDEAFTLLKDYLKNINQEKYEILIIELIKLSILEDDLTFSKPIETLNLISAGKFEFEDSFYIQKFYEMLSINKISLAKIYLNILSSMNDMNKNSISNLKESLEIFEKKLSNNEENKTSDDNSKDIDIIYTKIYCNDIGLVEIENSDIPEFKKLLLKVMYYEKNNLPGILNIIKSAKKEYQEDSNKINILNSLYTKLSNKKLTYVDYGMYSSYIGCNLILDLVDKNAVEHTIKYRQKVITPVTPKKQQIDKPINEEQKRLPKVDVKNYETRVKETKKVDLKKIKIKDIFPQEIMEVKKFIYVEMNRTKSKQLVNIWDNFCILVEKSLDDLDALDRFIQIVYTANQMCDYISIDTDNMSNKRLKFINSSTKN